MTPEPEPAQSSADARPTVLVTLTGEDRPGVTSAVFDAVTPTGALVLDLEQVVVRGQLTLGVLLRPVGDAAELGPVVRAVGERLAEEVPLGELVVVPGAGHAVHLERPDAVADALAPR